MTSSWHAVLADQPRWVGISLPSNAQVTRLCENDGRARYARESPTAKRHCSRGQAVQRGGGEGNGGGGGGMKGGFPDIVVVDPGWLETAHN